MTGRRWTSPVDEAPRTVVPTEEKITELIEDLGGNWDYRFTGQWWDE
jgi:hypothetical protein